MPMGPSPSARPHKFERPADVRFGAHSGLRSDIALGQKGPRLCENAHTAWAIRRHRPRPAAHFQ
jgi:hypothetical protein